MFSGLITHFRVQSCATGSFRLSQKITLRWHWVSVCLSVCLLERNLVVVYCLHMGDVSLVPRVSAIVFGDGMFRN